MARQPTAADLIKVMEWLVAKRGVPGHLRSDNGLEFVARTLQSWLADGLVMTLYIEPGIRWQTGHVGNFPQLAARRMLDHELLLSVAVVRVVIRDYRRHYNGERPHGGIRYRTPARAFNKAQTYHPKWRTRCPPLDLGGTAIRSANSNLSPVLGQGRGPDHRDLHSSL